MHAVDISEEFDSCTADLGVTSVYTVQLVRFERDLFSMHTD